mgnify:CR=1 FL=1
MLPLLLVVSEEADEEEDGCAEDEDEVDGGVSSISVSSAQKCVVPKHDE